VTIIYDLGRDSSCILLIKFLDVKSSFASNVDLVYFYWYSHALNVYRRANAHSCFRHEP
jgi:hypothetical protein